MKKDILSYNKKFNHCKEAYKKYKERDRQIDNEQLYYKSE